MTEGSRVLSIAEGLFHDGPCTRQHFFDPIKFSVSPPPLFYSFLFWFLLFLSSSSFPLTVYVSSRQLETAMRLRLRDGDMMIDRHRQKGFGTAEKIEIPLRSRLRRRRLLVPMPRYCGLDARSPLMHLEEVFKLVLLAAEAAVERGLFESIRRPPLFL